jgi:hypothetical protein
MHTDLTAIEVRVLGSLIEKEITTPDYYPLSLNALVAACNQKSNREPVVEYDETVVQTAVDSLRSKRLLWHVTGAGRTLKFDHNLRNETSLTPKEVAVLCTLMLRGPQTASELRTRSERMAPLASVEEVTQVLTGLMQRPDGALVAGNPRQPGQKENRFAHLLSGEPASTTVSQSPPPSSPEAPPVSQPSLASRVEALEAEVQRLAGVVADLRARLGDVAA